MNKTVMILGAGTMQIPSIRIAKKNGWRVIVADANPDAEGRVYADEFAQVDLKDLQGMEKAARHYNDLFGLGGIFTAGTDFSTTVAYIAEKLNLPGIPYEAACNATNKSQMRSMFKIHSVPCPDFITISPDDDPDRVSKKLSFPLVVKPVDNMGARGVRKVTSALELPDAVADARNASRSSMVIVEEYMKGPELSLDAIVYNGNITICGIADRHICFPPYFVEMGHTMPTSLSPYQVEQVADVFCKGIRALGITKGAAKGDIIFTENGPKIGEIAARLSGGYMSGWTFPYSSGIEVTEAALRIAVGLEPGNLESRYNHFSAERAFISIPGEIDSILNFDRARHMNHIQAAFLRVKPGDRVVFPRNNIQKCGNIISKAPSRDEAVDSAESAIKSILLRLSPDDEETDNFLFGQSPDQWLNKISAYPLKDPLVKELLKQSPYVSGSLCHVNPGKISIMPFPSLAESRYRDWHGLTILDALKAIERITGISAVLDPDADFLVLGKIFWAAFLKGGIQGGLYIIDTILKACKQESGIMARIERWLS